MSLKLLSIGALVAALAGFLTGYLPREPTKVVFFSVGQGDSALIRMEGASVLVDTGPAYRDYDAGSALVVPKLREQGVASLALVFLTHPDGDHIGGTNAVLERYPEATIVMNAAFRSHPDIGKIPSNRILWTTGESRWRIGEAFIQCYAPPVGENDNDGSLFLHIEDHGAAAVLTGDAPAAMEEKVAGLADWSAQVMTTGHHGSRSALSAAWLREVHPRFAIVSCGRDNQYGHPHKETLDLLRRMGIETHRTDEEGDLSFIERNGRFVTTHR